MCVPFILTVTNLLLIDYFTIKLPHYWSIFRLIKLWDKVGTTMELRKAKEKEPEKELVYPNPAAMELAVRIK